MTRSSSPSGGSSSAESIPNPTTAGTTAPSTTPNTPTTNRENANESNENLRNAEVNSLNISQLNERLNSVNGDIAVKYNELIAIYEGSRANPPTVRLDTAAQLQLENHIKNYSEQFETAIAGVSGETPQARARRMELTSLQNHARNTVEVMMNARNAGFQEYMELAGDDLMDRINNAIRNPMDFGKWMEIFASASVLLRYFGVMGKAKYKNRGVQSQVETQNNENNEQDENNEESNQAVDLMQVVGVEHTATGLTTGGYRIDAQGNAFRGESPVAMAALPENIKHLARFMQQNQVKLRYLNRQLDSSSPEKSLYQIAFIAVRLGQTSKFQGIDPVVFLKHNMEHVLAQFAGWSTAGRRGVENVGAVWDAFDTHVIDNMYRVVADYGTETVIRHELLNTITENPDRLARWVAETDINALMSGKESEWEIPEAEQGWTIAPVPQWTEGGSTLEFAGGYSMDVMGNVTLNGTAVPAATELPSGMKEIRDFVTANQAKLNAFAEKIDSGNAQNVGEVRMPALLAALRLQMYIQSKGGSGNAFDYLKSKWGGSEGIGDSGIYGQYSEGIGESLAEVGTVTAGTAVLGAGVGAVAGSPLGPFASLTAAAGAGIGLGAGLVAGGVSLVNEIAELADDMISFEETINKEILTEKMPEDNYEILVAYYDQNH